MSDAASSPVALTRFAGSAARAGEDAVAEEEPLEIRVDGVPLAVVMRTPGHDRDLVQGFLLTERVIEAARDVASIRHCDVARDPAAAENVVQVRLREGASLDLEALRRNFFASSSCGVCGKASVENALAHALPLDDPARFEPDLFYTLPARLAAAQPGFAATGGLHAAGLFAPDGALLAAREDIGRHNAVDKVVGWALAEGRVPLCGHVLLVSGRISYEIVQKALAARLPVVAAVSAPSSLAIRLAAEAGIALVGFLRGRGLNVYGARDRVRGGVG
jgi:FdhD protein